jgi:hypothetical protein
MRRGWLVAVVGVVVCALAGCAKPAGVDGDLTNAWPALPQAKTPVPKAGVCYPVDYDPTWYGDFDKAVDCTASSHRTETVYVGSFSGADADRSAPPLAGSAARKTAYTQCTKAANDYLGGDWQSGKVDIGLVLPDDKAWTGGARWYRCDAVQFRDSNFDTVATEGSVKGGLTGAKPLAVTCLIVTDDGHNSVTKFEDVDCDKPHNGEFAGLYTAPDGAYPSDKDARRKLALTGCEEVVAHFLGFAGSKPLNPHLGLVAGGFNQDQWNLGDRSEHCLAVVFNGTSVNGARILGSMKGLKDGAPRKA